MSKSFLLTVQYNPCAKTLLICGVLCMACFCRFLYCPVHNVFFFILQVAYSVFFKWGGT